MRPGAVGPVGGPAAQRVARAELAHDRYRHAKPGVVTRFLDWLGRIFGHLTSGSGTGGGGGGSHALLVLLVVLLAVAVVFAVRAGIPRRRRRVAADAADADPLRPVDAAVHRQRAHELEQAGRADEALREWLRATVATVEERGVLPPRPGRTGASTAREAGPLLPEAATDLGTATAAFDEVWFGGRPATPEDVAAARRAADLVRDTRIATRATGPLDGLAVPS